MSDKKDKPGTLVRNPELQAMAKIDEILASLTEDQATRVVVWLLSAWHEVPNEDRGRTPNAGVQG